MALTATQKAKARTYLGYSDQHRMHDPRLESVLIGLSNEAEAQVAEVLAALARVEASILDIALANGGLKRVDEVEWYDASSARTERQKLGRMYVGRLSIILGCPIYSDVFGSNGYLGDSYLPGLGGGQTIPLG